MNQGIKRCVDREKLHKKSMMLKMGLQQCHCNKYHFLPKILMITEKEPGCDFFSKGNRKEAKM